MLSCGLLGNIPANSPAGFENRPALGLLCGSEQLREYWAALACSAAAPLRARRAQAGLLGALLLYAALWPHSPWQIRLSHGAGLGFRDVVLPNGIADERAYYYPSTGLLPVLLHRMEIAERHLPLPPFATALQGRAFRSSGARVASTCMVGFYGYFAGSKHVVDRCALTDPFLARIPYRQTRGFRPGHFVRAEPAGYVDSLVHGTNLLEDETLAELYARVQLAVSGPLFTRARWRAIWCLNVGSCAPGS
jgi:hypothetical protein